MAPPKKPTHVETLTKNALPHREENTAVVQSLRLPSTRAALFIATENNTFQDNGSNELSFSALSPEDKAVFQLLLYLTYCCKGEVLQVTLEDPDYETMSPSIREDFAHGRMFCFVLNMSKEDGCETTTLSWPKEDEESLGDQLWNLTDVNVDMDVFRHDDDEEEEEDDGHSDGVSVSSMTKRALEEAYEAFMRLQLVRMRVSSLTNAMIPMKVHKEELRDVFDWVDIRNDSLHYDKLDKKKVRNLQGSMFNAAFPTGRQGPPLPDSIADLRLAGLKDSIDRITDFNARGQGKDLFYSIMSNLTATQWLNHKVVEQGYEQTNQDDKTFLEKLKAFTLDLSDSKRGEDAKINGLLVFKYSLRKLIDFETPDLFAKYGLHRHVAVPKNELERVLGGMQKRRRTRALSSLLNNGQCNCTHKKDTGACGGDCQIAHSCFYNHSDRHPFDVRSDDRGSYFSRLYPHLGKLERLSKEMKQKYGGCVHFESIVNMVFCILLQRRFSARDSLYGGLAEVIDRDMRNSSLSLGHSVPRVHEVLYLAPGKHRNLSENHALNPLKVYDQALVRYLFSDTLQVGRLFQASTTFNYIISNTAPRYTIERIMLFNITGPGEGKVTQITCSATSLGK